ncbi:nicotinate dehydrogenase subunit A [Pseudomonas duriflava]|uniref:Nicotinate dehydrogenase subunit A n=1 Tax=Pseudomonas duriflava TaxID=459528 RepID=A0A562QAK8_9PSED|nr:(2Fe-2S)-binding protein [Pseudomonas duriflava]TWI53763.1 nicotinate dehydrogenase subunit A [Pseudomonas duriflava]
MTVLSLTINGITHKVDADPQMPLLYVLRNIVGITSPKFGCGLSECGACTVLVEGKPVRACCVPVVSFSGQAVTTLEGLSTSDAPHPLQQAFIDEQAVQCGYCISGMIMTAHALLMTNPSPTSEEIKLALMGNLCGCGTHVRIVRAIQRAATMLRAGQST